jgi:hypothetical protein
MCFFDETVAESSATVIGLKVEVGVERWLLGASREFLELGEE